VDRVDIASLLVEGRREIVGLGQVRRDRADVNLRAKSFGQTPLVWASENNSASVAELLLLNGADVNINNSSVGWPSGLHIAAINNHHEVAEKLIHHGADVNMQSTVNIRLCLQKIWIIGLKYFYDATVSSGRAILSRWHGPSASGSQIEKQKICRVAAQP